MPSVSVVVPNYNHARFLHERLDTIFAQTFQDFELILLDDCSTDDSRTVLSSYASDSRVRLEFNETNSGSVFKQWNKGVRLARGEYVWIAESDDYAGAHFLERLVGLLDADSQVAFAYCQSWRVSAGGTRDGFADTHLQSVDPKHWATDYCADGKEECRNYFVRATSVPSASAVVFRKSLYQKANGADENLRLCGDWKLWAAMALTGRVAYISEPLNYFRCHGASMRAKASEMNVDALEYLAVMRWVLTQVLPPKAVLENIGVPVANMWVPAVMSFRVPFHVKREILQNVWDLDPHPLRNAIRPALLTLQRKFLHHWNALRPTSRMTP